MKGLSITIPIHTDDVLCNSCTIEFWVGCFILSPSVFLALFSHRDDHFFCCCCWFSRFWLLSHLQFFFSFSNLSFFINKRSFPMIPNIFLPLGKNVVWFYCSNATKWRIVFHVLDDRMYDAHSSWKRTTMLDAERRDSSKQQEERGLPMASFYRMKFFLFSLEMNSVRKWMNNKKVNSLILMDFIHIFFVHLICWALEWQNGIKFSLSSLPFSSFAIHFIFCCCLLSTFPTVLLCV